MRRTRPTDLAAAGLAFATWTGALVLGSAPALAADPERGRLLYDNHCTGCHTSVVHVRERRKARNPAELRAWIDHWRAELVLPWIGEDADDVAAYLGEHVYRFTRTP